jgi:cell division protein FtsW (lipid II flippase)
MALRTTQLSYTDRCNYMMSHSSSLMSLKQSMSNAKDRFNAMEPWKRALVIIVAVVCAICFLYWMWLFCKLDRDNLVLMLYMWLLVFVLGLLVYFVF